MHRPCRRIVRAGWTAILAATVFLPAVAHAAYWNLFNEEGESRLSAQYVTYATRNDMLTDTHRTGVFTPDRFGAGVNIVDSGSNGSTYWNLFNAEGESRLSAQYVTYATLGDMLGDTNRTGIFTPDTFGAGINIVGGGSDGTTYWNLFNQEGESRLSAQYVTYATLGDMLNDTHRVGIFTPDRFGAGVNIVGGGSDGALYWNLFNEEGESRLSAQYVTYGTLGDMLNDMNRIAIFSPDTFAAGANIVGTGADILPTPGGGDGGDGGQQVPEPSVVSLIFVSAAALLRSGRRSRARQI